MNTPNPMNKKGFTLIELLIVVVIIGILAAIAIPRFSETRERAFQSTVVSDLRNLQTVQEQFYADPANEFTYGGSADIIDADLWSPSDAVDVVIADVSSAGWSATATHGGLPAAANSCEIAVGDAAVGVASGEIICDWDAAEPAA